MAMSRLALVVPAMAALAVVTLPALAQIGQRDAPIEITSAQSEYLQNEGRGVYTGNVVATQGDAQIKTEKLTAVCSKGPAGSNGEPSCDELEQLIAEGSVFYMAPDVRIRGDRAQYDFPSDTITITGDVILSRGEDGVVKGTRVVYSIGEGRTVITAGEKRVVTLFNTAKKATPAESTTPAPTQPAPTTPN